MVRNAIHFCTFTSQNTYLNHEPEWDTKYRQQELFGDNLHPIFRHGGRIYDIPANEIGSGYCWHLRLDRFVFDLPTGLSYFSILYDFLLKLTLVFVRSKMVLLSPLFERYLFVSVKSQGPIVAFIILSNESRLSQRSSHYTSSYCWFNHLRLRFY